MKENPLNSGALEGEFSSATVSFFVHATEDENRLINLVSESLQIPRADMKLEHLKSYYGNALISVKARIIGKHAGEIGRNVLFGLDEEGKRTLSLEIEKSMDEHDALFLRLDRQLLSKTLALGYAEPVRIKLKPKNRYGGRKKVVETYRELLRPT